jgi:hypothetical protein
MIKWACAVVLGCALSAAAAVYVAQSYLDAEGLVRRERERGRQLDATRLAQKRFGEHMNAVLSALSHDQIDSCEACELIHSWSAEMYPDFVHNLRMVEGSNLNERIGIVVLRHFEDLALEEPKMAVVAGKVARELGLKKFRTRDRDH